jgi:hypothetical protein
VSEWTIATLKEHFDRILSDRDAALKLAVHELERRLDNLNHAHEQARENNRDFLKRDAHESFAAEIRKEIGLLRDQIIAMQKPQWPVWIGFFMALMAVVGALWVLAVNPINESLQRLDKQVTAHSEQMNGASHKR